MSDQSRISDDSPLAVRHFVAKSLNVCVVQSLGRGGVLAKWNMKPSQEDMDELSQFIQGVLGGHVTSFIEGTDRQAGISAYQKWLKEHT